VDPRRKGQGLAWQRRAGPATVAAACERAPEADRLIEGERDTGTGTPSRSVRASSDGV
jgi:hypothetical protein